MEKFLYIGPDWDFIVFLFLQTRQHPKKKTIHIPCGLTRKRISMSFGFIKQINEIADILRIDVVADIPKYFFRTPVWAKRNNILFLGIILKLY